ncbi:pyrroloquinoline quinone biosynthesis protein B [Muriicola jejuensis]|uniref:Pyrroloquinoline quinone biosynthesis protein PqqB n=1 Tax=Muriicola jejuensis TaxID=504488 RepID=A0A6P0UBS5_9FLAO|nr:MBL fold metallo-hydrolase [Muriicola jejuensis]NER09950.1 pyrroloquinoline quinone biosynthesis protein PqqB [Muriicola jejuensis]SMP04502.1 pyrroloquinoline quinone biosynthesis protein B [Muriicola jejuensis]
MTIRPLKNQVLIGVFLALVLLLSCRQGAVSTQAKTQEEGATATLPAVQLVVLGTVQDAGSPQIGCEKECCRELFEDPDPRRKVVSLGLVDRLHEKRFLFEATPDIASQLALLNRISGVSRGVMPDGVFLTHAHIGHYAGLMFFGKEAINAGKVSVFAMGRMTHFLENNGPWDQLVSQNNISVSTLEPDSLWSLTPSVSVEPILVPHRDEYSETVGYLISGPRKKALFIPDIDKWDRWDRDISKLISGVDYAFLDATFFDGDEIQTRDMSAIPHPFVVESMKLFGSLPQGERQKIHFIHFNHTNPLLSPDNKAYNEVISEGFRIAAFGDRFSL